ncbi:hypothetical protein CDG81_03710 [Actinopolyspora erythraea]|uniref:Uncharacterized protein n=1 Tax=Actinopolyspora erythraea TaxID=414996 RepID=A0A099D3Q6_9ACTN|nr:hypothetical protein [Actinopolyspora erythraea]ASU77562.1 hypothetical protein CDG81_03710 [Actinopolyspora erythraea]KGI80442.1 hypothetical protein IL38_17245 [Actinopolyspora erythraea]
MPEPRDYMLAMRGDLNPDLPTRNHSRPVVDVAGPQSSGWSSQWAPPAPDLLQEILDGLNELT